MEERFQEVQGRSQIRLVESSKGDIVIKDREPFVQLIPSRLREPLHVQATITLMGHQHSMELLLCLVMAEASGRQRSHEGDATPFASRSCPNLCMWRIPSALTRWKTSAL